MALAAEDTAAGSFVSQCIFTEGSPAATYGANVTGIFNQFHKPILPRVHQRLEEEPPIPDSVHKICPIHFSFTKIGGTDVLILVYFVTPLITETLSLWFNSPINHKCDIFVWNWGKDNVCMCDYVRNTRVREKASAAPQDGFGCIDWTPSHTAHPWLQSVAVHRTLSYSASDTSKQHGELISGREITSVAERCTENNQPLHVNTKRELIVDFR